MYPATIHCLPKDELLYSIDFKAILSIIKSHKYHILILESSYSVPILHIFFGFFFFFSLNFWTESFVVWMIVESSTFLGIFLILFFPSRFSLKKMNSIKLHLLSAFHQISFAHHMSITFQHTY